jgi:ADP-heptose:LPS heptosyltransferase
MEPLFNGIIEKNKLVVIDPKEFFLGNRLSKNNGRKLIKQIEPNTVIDLSGNMASASLIFTSGAVKIIGLRSEHSLPLIYELYDMSTKIRREPHLMDMYLDVVELIKPISRDHTHYEFPIKSTDSNIALIHPNAGWKAKEWGIDNFLELGKKLKSHFDVRFISENCFHPLIEEKLKNEGFGIIITKNLNDLILHINDAFILISNDTGPVHVAAFLGIPTFTIFGPTNPDFCKPIGSRHFAFQKKIECSPVYENYCNKYGGYYCEHNKCMTSISNEDVYHSILNFIDCIRKF